MLSYKDTKLRRRKEGVARTIVNIYKGAAAKALAVSEPIVGWQNMAAVWQNLAGRALAPSHVYNYVNNIREAELVR